MKYIIITVLLSTLLKISVHAQEFTVNYEIRTEMPDSLEITEPENLKDIVNAVLYVKDEFVSVKLDVVGRESSVQVTVDTEQERGVLLLKEDPYKVAKVIDSNYRKHFIDTTHVQLLPEKKIILGQTCLKAEYEKEDGSRTTVWYVPGYEPEIRIDKLIYNRIPGIVLEAVTEGNGVISIVKATSFEENVEQPENVFVLSIPDDYELVEGP